MKGMMNLSLVQTAHRLLDAGTNKEAREARSLIFQYVNALGTVDRKIALAAYMTWADKTGVEVDFDSISDTYRRSTSSGR